MIAVGDLDGAKVGKVVGGRLGEDVGAWEGEKVGLLVGEGVGEKQSQGFDKASQAVELADVQVFPLLVSQHMLFLRKPAFAQVEVQ